jgi:phenylalanyl-tRNA synthetase beta chain
VQKELELLNPIVNTLDTLRPTLLHWLLKSASHNKKNGFEKIALFELGTVFDTQRNESIRLSFIWSGVNDRDTLRNNGKPSVVDFEFFVQKIADVIGDFTLQPFQTTHKLAHSYQVAAIFQNGKQIGELFRVHPLVEKAFDLDVSFLCELDFEKLPYGLKTAQKISKFQASFRDLSLLVPQELSYDALKAVVEEAKTSEVVRFYPVDRYSDEKLGDKVSLTLRFMLRSDEKTLEEGDINSAMEAILDALNQKLSVGLR